MDSRELAYLIEMKVRVVDALREAGLSTLGQIVDAVSVVRVTRAIFMFLDLVAPDDREASHLAPEDGSTALSASGLVLAPVFNAGLHVSALLLQPLNESDIQDRLADRGVAVDGFAPYAARPSTEGSLIIGLGRVDTERLGEALEIADDVLG